MANSTHSDILYGRPYGGVMTLISKNLREITETIFCSERYTVIKVANSLIVNYPRRARNALGVDTVLTLDVCLYVCLYVCMYVC